MGLHQVSRAVGFLNNDCNLVGFEHPLTPASQESQPDLSSFSQLHGYSEAIAKLRSGQHEKC